MHIVFVKKKKLIPIPLELKLTENILVRLKRSRSEFRNRLVSPFLKLSSDKKNIVPRINLIFEI